jgi:hypothetical protein
MKKKRKILLDQRDLLASRQGQYKDIRHRPFPCVTLSAGRSPQSNPEGATPQALGSPIGYVSP